MRYHIDPGRERRSINFIDNIPYSHVTDLEGRPLELRLSLMVQNGNSEARLAVGRDDEPEHLKQPFLVWFNGAGWRECDKNLQCAEMAFLAEAGYAVAFIHYRNSAEGKWPSQLIDCKTAVRFLKAHAEEYGLDPDRAGVLGRSAGGHLAAFMAMNLDGYDTEEWKGCSSKVHAAVDYFGVVDVTALNLLEMERVREPGYRWHSIEETHGFALLGGDRNTFIERSDAASANRFINDGMCPICILHGDRDAIAPVSISEAFYEKLSEAGLEDRADLYIVKGAGHGTREFSQPMIRKTVLAFLDHYLK